MGPQGGHVAAAGPESFGVVEITSADELIIRTLGGVLIIPVIEPGATGVPDEEVVGSNATMASAGLRSGVGRKTHACLTAPAVGLTEVRPCFSRVFRGLRDKFIDLCREALPALADPFARFRELEPP